MKIDVGYIICNQSKLWNEIRWGNKPPYCQCGCYDIYRLADGRYKCKKCGKIFSDTSNTILQNSKLSKWKWLYAIYTLTAQRSISIRELGSLLSVTKSTAHKMLMKIRCYMSLDDIDLSGVVAMDEAHISGWSGMHLKKKIEYMVNNNYMKKGERYNKKAILQASSQKKEHILCAVNAVGQAKVTHIKGQISKDIVKQFVRQNNITHIISDESPLYRFKGVITEQCNHSKHIYMTKTGHTSNPCENRFSWVKRILTAYHTHTSQKYLQLYLNQILFKINNKDLTATAKFIKLGKLCCQKYISYKDVKQFDYTSQFCYPEEIDWTAIIQNSGGFIQQVKVGHKIYS